MKKLAVVLIIVLTLVVAGVIAITFAVRHFFIAAIRELGATSVLNAVYWTKDGEDADASFAFTCQKTEDGGLLTCDFTGEDGRVTLEDAPMSADQWQSLALMLHSPELTPYDAPSAEMPDDGTVSYIELTYDDTTRCYYAWDSDELYQFLCSVVQRLQAAA